MNNKKVNQKEREKKIDERKELEELIKESGESLDNLTKEAMDLAPKSQPIVFNHEEIEENSIQEATDIVESSAKFYLEEDVIKEEHYIQQKINADVITMTDMIKQSKVAEYAIFKMIQQIDEGNMHPRQFEVLSGFQRSKLELTKTIAQYVVMMENNFKNIKEDYKNKKNENTLDSDYDEEDNEEERVERGTRSFMQRVRGAVDDVNAEKKNAEKINKENE